MKTQTLRIHTIAALAGFLISGGSTAYPQAPSMPGTGDESADQVVQLGDTATFSVDATPGFSYQWMRNGMAISGQTNSTLTLENAQIADAGFYSCNVASGADVATTSAASLEIFTVNPDFLVVVFAAPIVSGGDTGSCPGPYTGYVIYYKAATNGWGWAPSTNTTVYTASDTTRTNTKVEYSGDYGDEGCAKTTVTIPYPTYSPLYRFAIYFTNDVPTTNYPITLSGFNP
jgi:hypothetical protein